MNRDRGPSLSGAEVVRLSGRVILPSSRDFPISNPDLIRPGMPLEDYHKRIKTRFPLRTSMLNKINHLSAGDADRIDGLVMSSPADTRTGLALTTLPVKALAEEANFLSLIPISSIDEADQPGKFGWRDVRVTEDGKKIIVTSYVVAFPSGMEFLIAYEGKENKPDSFITLRLEANINTSVLPHKRDFERWRLMWDMEVPNFSRPVTFSETN